MRESFTDQKSAHTHRSARRRDLFLSAALIGCLAIGGSARAGKVPRYEVAVLPSVTVGDIELPTVTGVAINESGQVAGRAQNRFGQVVGFRHSPDGETLTFDPEGTLRTLALFINERGDVAGWRVNSNGRLSGAFLFSDEGGLSDLENGLPEQGNRLIINGLNNLGQVFGGKGKATLLYTPDIGWEDLRPLDPRLEKAALEGFNDNGDLVFRRILGTERPLPLGGFVNRLETLVVRDSGEILSFGDVGPLVLFVGQPNSRGELPVSLFTEDNLLVPAYWTPSGGVETFEIAKTIQAFSAFLTDNGDIGGLASKKSERRSDILYIRPTRPGGTERRVKPRRFTRMARNQEHDGFDDLDLVAMNENSAVLGNMAIGSNLSVPFLFDPAFGLRPVQAFLDAAGVDLQAFEALALNDRGQIVVTVTGEVGRFTTVVLTPIEN